MFKITDHFAFNTSDQIVCSCCQRVKINKHFEYHLGMLERLRDEVSFPISVNCGYRCPSHNLDVGGAPNSLHMEIATDVRPSSNDPDDLEDLLESANIFNFDGIGIYNTFIHLDSRNFIGRGRARWNKRV
jgi:uncharacterized protein YcbK (DUF882 family)